MVYLNTSPNIDSKIILKFILDLTYHVLFTYALSSVVLDVYLKWNFLK